jgi:hypothetical protein
MQLLPHRLSPLRAIFEILGAYLHEHDPAIVVVPDRAASATFFSVTGSILQDTTEKCS